MAHCEFLPLAMQPTPPIEAIPAPMNKAGRDPIGDPVYNLDRSTDGMNGTGRGMEPIPRNRIAP
jgi:hypothetical protein